MYADGGTPTDAFGNLATCGPTRRFLGPPTAVVEAENVHQPRALLTAVPSRGV